MGSLTSIRKRHPKDKGGCYEIDLDRIMNLEDIRTTIMIKNIPNKYDMKQMLREINSRHKDRFDFFYLPIDYGNHCNVGYAFINFLHAAYILDFYRDYNGKGWPNYNSEKICDLKYGRIQGKAELKRHFSQTKVFKNQNKKLKPQIFDSRKVDPASIEKIIEDHRSRLQKRKEDRKSATQQFSSNLRDLN